MVWMILRQSWISVAYLTSEAVQYRSLYQNIYILKKNYIKKAVQVAPDTALFLMQWESGTLDKNLHLQPFARHIDLC